MPSVRDVIGMYEKAGYSIACSGLSQEGIQPYLDEQLKLKRGDFSSAMEFGAATSAHLHLWQTLNFNFSSPAGPACKFVLNIGNRIV